MCVNVSKVKLIVVLCSMQETLFWQHISINICVASISTDLKHQWLNGRESSNMKTLRDMVFSVLGLNRNNSYANTMLFLERNDIGINPRYFTRNNRFYGKYIPTCYYFWRGETCLLYTKMSFIFSNHLLSTIVTPICAGYFYAATIDGMGLLLHC